MIDLSKRSNLLEQDPYKYKLQDVEEPNLYRDIYPYSEVPKIPLITAGYPWGCRIRFGLRTLPFEMGSNPALRTPWNLSTYIK